MLSSILTEINPKGLIPAGAAHEIASNFGAFKLIAQINELVYAAALNGLHSIKFEVFRNANYDACKAYQQNDTLTYVLRMLQGYGYETYFVLGEDEKTSEYFAEVLLSWKKK
jgi:5-carboxymethyl-2-hydroxymuconate isomerase